jgi:hypothetical protein
VTPTAMLPGFTVFMRFQLIILRKTPP